MNVDRHFDVTLLLPTRHYHVFLASSLNADKCTLTIDPGILKNRVDRQLRQLLELVQDDVIICSFQ